VHAAGRAGARVQQQLIGWSLLMAAYATLADLVDAFGQGELDEVAPLDGDVAQEDRVEASLVSACSQADSKAALRYAVPVATVPPILRQVVLDIARFRLWGARASEEVRQRYEDAVDWLDDLAAGKAALIDEDGQSLPPPAAAVPASRGFAVAGYPSTGAWARLPLEA
jgi:phage gp36-like protein